MGFRRVDLARVRAMFDQGAVLPDMPPLEPKDFAWPHSRENCESDNQAFSEPKAGKDPNYLLSIHHALDAPLCSDRSHQGRGGVPVHHSILYGQLKDGPEIPTEMRDHAG